jgi:hypothetical protein
MTWHGQLVFGYDPQNAPDRPEEDEMTTITIDGEQRTIPEARVLLGIPEYACFGCYLGDAAPETHDQCFLSEWDD